MGASQELAFNDSSRSPLERADSILGAFDPDHPSLTLLGLIARTGLPRTTVHRTVRKMIELGWIEHHGDRYSIGTRMFERAALAGRPLSVRDAALPFLQALWAATHETVHLAVLDGNEVVIVEKLVGQRPVTALTRVGGRMPALCTALGKVLTAFSPTHIAEDIIETGVKPRTPNTLTCALKIRQDLCRVREESVGYDREETALGLRCVAAPVVAADGSCVAAVSVTGPASRLFFTKLAPIVRHAAQRSSHALAATTATWPWPHRPLDALELGNVR